MAGVVILNEVFGVLVGVGLHVHPEVEYRLRINQHHVEAVSVEVPGQRLLDLLGLETLVSGEDQLVGTPERISELSE